jgi:F-type H+-transporting ATPase subunit epsilon
MHLNIITRDKKIFEGTITSLTVPGKAGSFQVWKDHAPIISTLKSGTVVYIQDAIANELPIQQGVLSAQDNQIIILAEV